MGTRLRCIYWLKALLCLAKGCKDASWGEVYGGVVGLGGILGKVFACGNVPRPTEDGPVPKWNVITRAIGGPAGAIGVTSGSLGGGGGGQKLPHTNHPPKRKVQHLEKRVLSLVPACHWPFLHE